MSDPIKRALRTFFQSALAIIAIQAGALMADAEDGVLDGGLWRRIAVTALVAGVIALVSFAQNELEQVTGKALLK